MPLATVTLNPMLAIDKKAFGEHLAYAIAKFLHCRDGALNPNEIEVRFREYGPHDLNVQDLMIEVVANDYPDRRATLEQRTEFIATNIRDYLGTRGALRLSLCGGDNFVWVMLVPAAFVKL